MCHISDTHSCATTVLGCLSESCVASLAPEGHAAALYDHDSVTVSVHHSGGRVGTTLVLSGCHHEVCLFPLHAWKTAIFPFVPQPAICARKSPVIIQHLSSINGCEWKLLAPEGCAGFKLTRHKATNSVQE